MSSTWRGQPRYPSIYGVQTLNFRIYFTNYHSYSCWGPWFSFGYPLVLLAQGGDNHTIMMHLPGTHRRRTRGVLKPSCTQKSKSRTGGFLGGKLTSNHGLFFSYEGQQGATNGHDSLGCFSEIHKALDGWMLARTAQSLYRHGPQHSIFLNSV